jgi:hypothetical protein
MEVKDWKLDFSTKVGDYGKVIGTNKIGKIIEKKEGINTIELDNKELLEVQEDKTRKVVFFYLYRNDL